MYRFEFRFNYLYALALTFLIVGMALWAFIPPRPAAVLPEGEVVLSPDTNVKLFSRGFFATPWTETSTELGRQAMDWLRTQDVKSPEEAMSWVLDHWKWGSEPFFDDVIKGTIYLRDHPGSTVGGFCDQISDAWLLLLNAKGLAKAGVQLSFRVKDPGGRWDRVEHGIGMAISYDEKTVYFFYTWPYGYYSFGSADGLQFGNSEVLDKVLSYLSSHPEAMPTSDGAYSVDELLSTTSRSPVNATRDESTGCPLYTGTYRGTAVVGPTVTEGGLVPVDLGQGGLTAFIQNNLLIMEARIKADWPNSDVVSYGLSGEVYRVYLSVLGVPGSLSLRFDMWSPACRNYRIYRLVGQRLPWNQTITINLPQGGPDYFFKDDGSPATYLGKDVKEVTWRNYEVRSNGYYSVWNIDLFKPYLLPADHPRYVTLIVGYEFPAHQQTIQYDSQTVVIAPKFIGVVKLIWDTETGNAVPIASGGLQLILNQKVYAPGERATAWVKANTSITNVVANIGETGENITFKPDNTFGNIWRADFNVPQKTGIYTLQVMTSLGYIEAKFSVTGNMTELNESRKPIVIKFDRDPPNYKVGELVTFTVAVNVNGTYSLRGYVTAPSGALESVTIQKIGSNLYQGQYSNTMWAGGYLLTVVLNGTGCVFYDKTANNIKEEAEFFVTGMPTSIKVWFDRSSYKPGSIVKVFASVNPMVDSALLILEDGKQIIMEKYIENTFKAEFSAPETLGEHYITIQAGGTAVRASFVVSNEDAEPKLVLMSDRDKYPLGETARIYAYIQNGIYGYTPNNPKLEVTLPSLKKVSLDLHQDGDFFWSYIKLDQAGTYYAHMELDYSLLLDVKKLKADTSFVVVGNKSISLSGISSILEPNTAVYDWLVSHGFPQELARILAMPITWIAAGILVIILSRRRKYYYYSGWMMR